MNRPRQRVLPILVALLGCCAWPHPGAGLTLVDQTAAGGWPNNGSLNGVVSDDGRWVIYESTSTNLVSGDTNGLNDIFATDLRSLRTVRLNLAPDGSQATGGYSYHPSTAGDGRYVVYYSYASNLVGGDTNGFADVFVVDRDTDGDGVFDEAGGTQTTRASVTNSGGQLDRSSMEPDVSADGRYVAFVTSSTIVVGGLDGVVNANVFIRDRVASTTFLATRSTGGTEANGDCNYPRLADVRRRVVYECTATNLVGGDANGAWDVFVHDWSTSGTFAVSWNDAGTQLVGGGSPDISGDGNWAAFTSFATNVVPGDTNGVWDVFVRDLVWGINSRVNVANNGAQATGYSSGLPRINGDGTVITFHSAAPNLVPGDTNGQYDVFRHDRRTRTTTRFNVDTSNAQATGGSTITATVSRNGQYVTFDSTATNLLPSDTNGQTDTFYQEAPFRVSRASVSGAEAQSATGGALGYRPWSGQGRWLAFQSSDAALSSGDANGALDVYVRDRDANGNGFFDESGSDAETVLVSRANDGAIGNGASHSGSLSRNGRFLVFVSDATNLDLSFPDVNGYPDIFLVDRDWNMDGVMDQAGQYRTTLENSNGPQGATGPSSKPSISDDGATLVYATRAPNLSPNDNNGVQDILIENTINGFSDRASKSTSGVEGNADSDEPMISGDASTIAYSSLATNLVSGDTNARRDCFVHSRATTTTFRISLATGGAQGTGGDCTAPYVSGTGRYIAYASTMTNLVSGDTNGVADAFVYDRDGNGNGIFDEAGEAKTARVSLRDDGSQLTNGPTFVSVSDDGRYVTFDSGDNSAVPDDSNTARDVFVRDRDADADGVFDESGTASTTRILSAAADGSRPAAQASSRPIVSHDGRWLAYDSDGSNLVTGDSNGQGDVFVATNSITSPAAFSNVAQGLQPATATWRATSPALDVDFFNQQNKQGLKLLEHGLATTPNTAPATWRTIASLAPPYASKYQTDWTIPAADLAQGPNYVSVRMFSGHSAQSVHPDVALIKYDTTAPQIINNLPAGFDQWTNGVGPIEVYFADAHSGLSLLEYGLGVTSGGTERKPWTAIATFATDGVATHTTSWPIDSSALAQGVNYLNVRATDRAGNQATQAGIGTIRWDTVIPTITNSEPTSFGTTWRSILAAVNADFSDASSGLQEFEYSLGTTSGAEDVRPWQTHTSFAYGETNSYTADWPIETAVLRQGTNWLNVRASDYAGNQPTKSGLLTIQWDSQAPTINQAHALNPTPTLRPALRDPITLAADVADPESGIDAASDQFTYRYNSPTAPATTIAPTQTGTAGLSAPTTVAPSPSDDKIFWDYSVKDLSAPPNGPRVRAVVTDLATHAPEGVPYDPDLHWRGLTDGFQASVESTPACVPSCNPTPLESCHVEARSEDNPSYSCVGDSGAGDPNREDLKLTMTGRNDADPTTTISDVRIHMQRQTTATATTYAVAVRAWCTHDYGASTVLCPGGDLGTQSVTIPAGTTDFVPSTAPSSFTLPAEDGAGNYYTHYRIEATVTEKEPAVGETPQVLKVANGLRAYPTIVAVQASQVSASQAGTLTVAMNRCVASGTFQSYVRIPTGVNDWATDLAPTTSSSPVLSAPCKTATFDLTYPATVYPGAYAYAGAAYTEPSGYSQRAGFPAAATAGDGYSAVKATLLTPVVDGVLVDVNGANAAADANGGKLVFGTRAPNAANVQSTTWLRLSITGNAAAIEFDFPTLSRNAQDDSGGAVPVDRKIRFTNGNIRLELMEDYTPATPPSNLATQVSLSDNTQGGATASNRLSGSGGKVRFTAAPGTPYTGTYWVRATLIDVSGNANNVLRDGTYSMPPANPWSWTLFP